MRDTWRRARFREMWATKGAFGVVDDDADGARNPVRRAGWQDVSLGEIMALEYGKALKDVDRDGGDYPVYGSAGIVGWHSKAWVTEAPWIVVGRKGTAGSVHLVRSPGWPIDTTYWVSSKSSSVLVEFLYLLLQAADLPKLCAQTGVPGLNRERVYALKVLLPPLGEQRRIVDLISSIDQAIEAAKPLISLVDAVWASLIAKETSEVEQIGLREVVATAKAGGTPSRDRPDFYNGDIPWLKSGEVANGEISEAEEAITEKGLANSSAWLVPAGAVLVAMYGATAGAVGYLQRPMATNQAVLALIGEPSQVDQRFLYHWLRSRAEHMKARATGAAQPNLSKARVLEEPFPLLDVESQRGLSITLDSILDIADQAKKFVSVATSLRNQLGAALLSGEHTIPESYDHLLEDAS